MQVLPSVLADVPIRIHEFFTALDWIVIFTYLGATTLVGHLMRGKQSTISDFFAGGRTLPWMAVCGSIIATEISGVTFIGVAGSVLAANGDFGYMIWGVGSVIGRCPCWPYLRSSLLRRRRLQSLRLHGEAHSPGSEETGYGFFYRWLNSRSECACAGGGSSFDCGDRMELSSLHPDYWNLCRGLDPDGRNANSYMD